MAYENRFEQYDIFMEQPAAAGAAHLRLPVPERIDARGEIIMPLDEAAFAALVADARERRASRASRSASCIPMSIRVHEQRARDVLAKLAPASVDHAVERSLAGDARIRALVDGLRQRLRAAGDGRAISARLEDGLRARGFACPLYS